jgi:hypothetical protein
MGNSVNVDMPYCHHLLGRQGGRICMVHSVRGEEMAGSNPRVSKGVFFCWYSTCSPALCCSARQSVSSSQPAGPGAGAWLCMVHGELLNWNWEVKLTSRKCL